jgi:hypothetical protein
LNSPKYLNSPVKTVFWKHIPYYVVRSKFEIEVRLLTRR